MRTFVVVGNRATTSPGFLLDDVPGTSGRLDLLLRCVRAALLVSHGVRRDTRVYLVLLGGPDAPRSLRFDGALAKYFRPDERSMAVLVQKALATPRGGEGFVVLRHGVAVAEGGLEVVLADLADGPRYLLDERAVDVRTVELATDGTFFLGDHLGLDEPTRALLGNAVALSIGPVSVHADDAIAVVSNELDRRMDPAGPPEHRTVR